jgi:hypothetical protein
MESHCKGRAPLNSLLDSIRSAQKTDFEKIITEREQEAQAPLLPTVWLRKDRPAPGSEEALGVMKSAKVQHLCVEYHPAKIFNT